jgi:hypothetical protein
MDILDPETITTAQHSACIVRLEDIFKNNGDMPGTKSDYFAEFLLFVIGNEIEEIAQNPLSVVKRVTGRMGHSYPFQNELQK